MRKGIYLSLTLAVIIVTASSNLAAEVLGPFSISTEEGGLRISRQHLLAEDFDVMTIEGCDFTRQWGEPMLPVKSTSVYVPRGMAVRGVRVIETGSRELRGAFRLLPVQEELPLSFVGPARPIPPDREVYAMDTPYPESCVKIVTSGSIGGRKIVALQVFPIQYTPSDGAVTLNENIVFEIEIGPAGQEPVVPLETPNVRNLRNSMVRDLVENPGDLLADFPDGSGTLDPSVATEYLILCHENHADAYEMLREWKTRKGVPADIYTTQDAIANYPGRDDPERLRNCIMDYYQNESTAWVLMTMTAPKAKIRGCHGQVGGSIDNEIPCDLYFADMDGDWDQDDDGIWGERYDDADLYPDVYVGRSTGNTAVKCSLLVNKTFTYEGFYGLPTDYQLDVLFMAEYADEYTNMGVCKNIVDNESMPARFDPILKLYQATGTLTHEAVMDAMNAGQGLINHAGHGNIGFLSIGDGGSLTKDDVQGLTNAPRYSVFYTLACLPAAFDTPTGCFAKSFTEAPEGGGFFVGNSRNGWYSSGHPGQGTGDWYEREFWQAVFPGGWYRLGVAHAKAKIERIPMSAEVGTNRWTMFAMNLFGDPEMQIWRDTPQTMTVSHPESLTTGNHMITVTVLDGGSPIDLATVCLWKDNEVYQVENTNPSGEAYFTFTVADTGEIRVTATAQDFIPYVGSIIVAAPSSGIGLDDADARGLSLRVTPNPIRGEAMILYSIPRTLASSGASMEVFDVSGRLLRSVSLEAAGSGSVAWDGRLDNGSAIRPGLYFVKLSSGNEHRVKKLVVLQ